MQRRREFLAAGLLAGTAFGQSSETAAAQDADAARTSLTIPKLVKEEDGETVWVWAGVLMTVKIRSEDTGGAYSMFEDWLPVGAGPQLHTHTREHEAMYVLEGEVRATLGGQTFALMPGTLLHMPLGVAHGFKNVSDRPARMLLTYAPGGFEKLFLSHGKPAKRGDTVPAIFTQQEVLSAIAASEQYGVFRERK